MKELLFALSSIPEFQSLLSALDAGACPAGLLGYGVLQGSDIGLLNPFPPNPGEMVTLIVRAFS